MKPGTCSRVIEMKESRAALDYGEEQIDELAGSFHNARKELEDFEWDMLSQTEAATSVPEDEAYPPLFKHTRNDSGPVYGPEEALEKARNCPQYELVNIHIFDGNIELAEDNMLQMGGPASLDHLLNGTE